MWFVKTKEHYNSGEVETKSRSNTVRNTYLGVYLVARIYHLKWPWLLSVPTYFISFEYNETIQVF